jgi:hypothetical protein
MMKTHYAELFTGTPDYDRAVAFSARVFELTEFLVHVVNFDHPDLGAPRHVALHTSCHARRQMGSHETSAALLDSLEALFALIEDEPEASVRAVLGHHLFVFIHPYVDGNGRIGRFLLNALLASGGYPWTVVRVTRRKAYLEALEEASVRGNILPLTLFLKAELEQWAPERE